MFKKKFDTINATIFILFLTIFGLSFTTLYKDYQKIRARATPRRRATQGGSPNSRAVRAARGRSRPAARGRCRGSPAPADWRIRPRPPATRCPARSSRSARRAAPRNARCARCRRDRTPRGSRPRRSCRKKSDRCICSPRRARRRPGRRP